MKTILESKKWLTLICLAAALSLTTTACGGDDDDATDNNIPVADAGNDADDKDDGYTDDEDDGYTDDEDDGYTDDEDDGYTDDEDDGYTDDDDDGYTDDDDGYTDDEDGNTDPEICDTNGYTVYSAQAARVDGEDDFLRVLSHDAAGVPLNQLTLQLHADRGGATEAGTYEFDDTNLDSCANCLLISNFDANETATAHYVAQSGTLEITNFGAVGEQFTATLSGVELIEVEFGAGNATTPVPDGANYCIDSLDFDLTLLAFDMGGDPDPPVWEAPTCGDADVGDGFEAVLTEGNLADNGVIVALLKGEVDDDTQLRDVLAMQLYGNSPYVGAPAEYVVGQTYDIDDHNFDTCTNCISIYEDCDDTDFCATAYNAGAGEFTIDTFDKITGEFKATLTGVEFVEVTADSVIIEDGGGWCIDSLVIEGTLDVPDVVDVPVCGDPGVKDGYTVADTTMEYNSRYEAIFINGWSSTTDPHDQLEIDLYEPAYVAGETYTITDDQLCDNCVVIQTECTGDMGACVGTKYTATEGTILIDEHDDATGALKLTVQDAMLTGDDGSGWCIDSVVLEGAYMPPTP